MAQFATLQKICTTPKKCKKQSESTFSREEINFHRAASRSNLSTTKKIKKMASTIVGIENTSASIR